MTHNHLITGGLYSQGGVSSADHEHFADALSKLFEIDRGEPVHIDTRRATLLLLVERIARNEPGEYDERQREGIMRLFELRGWRIGKDHGRAFDLEDDQRRFSVVIVDRARDIPAKDPDATAPGLTRAPLLVIHTQARREQLLIGNRGQFFHAAIEDIALMEPGTLGFGRCSIGNSSNQHCARRKERCGSAPLLSSRPFAFSGYSSRFPTSIGVRSTTCSPRPTASDLFVSLNNGLRGAGQR